MRGKSMAKAGAVMLGPAAAVLAFYLWMERSTDIPVILVGLHLLTFAWVALFFRIRPCRVSLLPGAVGPFLMETARPSAFYQYLGAALLAVFYRW